MKAIVVHVGRSSPLRSEDRAGNPHPSPRNVAWLKSNPWFDDELLPVLRRRKAELLAR